MLLLKYVNPQTLAASLDFYAEFPHASPRVRCLFLSRDCNVIGFREPKVRVLSSKFQTFPLSGSEESPVFLYVEHLTYTPLRQQKALFLLLFYNVHLPYAFIVLVNTVILEYKYLSSKFSSQLLILKLEGQLPPLPPSSAAPLCLTTACYSTSIYIVLVAVALQFGLFNRGSSDGMVPSQRNYFELCTRRLAN